MVLLPLLLALQPLATAASCADGICTSSPHTHAGEPVVQPASLPIPPLDRQRPEAHLRTATFALG